MSSTRQHEEMDRHAADRQRIQSCRQLNLVPAIPELDARIQVQVAVLYEQTRISLLLVQKQCYFLNHAFVLANKKKKKRKERPKKHATERHLPVDAAVANYIYTHIKHVSNSQKKKHVAEFPHPLYKEGIECQSIKVPEAVGLTFTTTNVRGHHRNRNGLLFSLHHKGRATS